MRRIFTAVFCAACAGLTGLAADSARPRLEVPAPLPPPDFVAGCPLPFADIAGHHSIDHACTIAGDLTADAANQEQNRTKNNFCATGTPVSVTQATFKNLQAATDVLPSPFTFGSHDTLPGDRTPIRSTGFVTTSDGDDVHEGTLVRTVAFLLHGAYSNTGTGEGVNCGIHGVESNDIHLALMKSKPTASSDECQSFTAEITPHARPDDWLVLSTLHKTKTKTAREKIAAEDLDRPLRITGQMMMDGSHTPCHNGKGSPKRISVWEIHPVYAIDRCKKTAITACRVDVEGDWQALDVWLAEQNGENGHLISADLRRPVQFASVPDGHLPRHGTRQTPDGSIR